ncbi:MAG: response regulator [Methyloligellaceae bacterium]
MSKYRKIRDVLIIDDDPILHEIVGAFVEQHGAERVLNASDGEMAIRVLQEPDHRIGLIFCDLNMPQKDGIEVLTHLRQSNSDIPLVIASSAEGHIVRSARELAEAYSLNLVGTLCKPIDFEGLRRVMAVVNGEDLCLA